MFQNLILNNPTGKKVLVLFDMDGTCVEYGCGEKKQILDNVPGYFYNKRPIYTVIDIMKQLNDTENITVGILSNCYYKEQKQDKIKWLKENLPFIKDENIHINVYSDEVYNDENKHQIKAKKIISLNLQKDQMVYLIEDDHQVISATNKIMPNTAFHISCLLK